MSCVCHGPGGMAGVGYAHGPGGMGRIGTWPSDVRELKERFNPAFLATNAGARPCPNLSIDEHAAWEQFYASWRAFYAEDEPWVFGSGAQYDEAMARKNELADWQSLLRSKGCVIVGPAIEKEKEGEAAFDAVKWLAIAAVAGVACYGVYTLRGVFR